MKPIDIRFPTTVRGVEVIAEVRASMAHSGVIVMTIIFEKDKELYIFPGLTKEDLAKLCREAAEPLI